MRSDMFKVIIDTVRSGGKGRKDKINDDRNKVPMNRNSYYNEKEFSDRLNPLMRFLRRNVGRPWDKIYSEICKQLSVKKHMHNHLRDHIKDMIWFNCQFDTRNIPYYWLGGDRFIRLSINDLYIDRNGILRVVTKKMARKMSGKLYLR